MATEENSEQKFELDLSDDSLKAVQVTETTPAALVSETVARRLIVYVAREFGTAFLHRQRRRGLGKALTQAKKSLWRCKK